MDVKCQNCSAEYSLDETLVAATGTSVRCTKCGQIFKVYRYSEAADQADKWLLRQVSGETYSFEHIGVLQQWIAEGKVSPDDLLTKEGQNSTWKRIGDIREMQSFFSLVNPPQSARTSQPVSPKAGEPVFAQITEKSPPSAEQNGGRASIRRTLDFEKPNIVGTNPPTATVKGVAETAPPAPIEPRLKSNAGPTDFPAYAPTLRSSGLDLSQIPASVKSEWDQGQEVVDTKGPAWAEKKREALPQYKSELDSLIPSKRKTGRWIVLLVILALVASGAAFFVMTQKNVGHSLDGFLDSSDDNRYKKFFDRGYENFLLDSETYYRQADREFQKVLALRENDALTQAALAEMYAVWAQYFSDAETDEKVDLSAKEEITEAENRELERLHNDFEERLSEATRWARLALAHSEVPREAHRAMADIMRLSGKPEAAQVHLDKARSDGSDPETDYVAVLLDQSTGKQNSELLKQLSDIISKKQLIRAMYRRARILAAESKQTEAKQVLAELFELNSEHIPGKVLIARINEDKPVLLQAAAYEEHKPADGITPSGKGSAADSKRLKRTTETASSTRERKPHAEDGSGSIDSMLIRAKRFQERGQTTNAMNLYNKVLERSPNNIDALSGLAYGYRDIHANGRAIATFRRVLGLQPSFGPALLGLAETFKNQGQKEQALKYYNKYLSTNPSGRYAGMAKRNVTLLGEEIAESATGQIEPEPSKKESITEDQGEPTPAENQNPKENKQEENIPEKKVIISPVSSETPQ
ncbi:MAG: tetratricopeptide repeat protein [Proteobacteria bacterium]|nr:tetratricopeptide repeat protein [Pseudomonadota bacterium]